MKNLIIPDGYKSSLDLLKTQKAIKMIKDFFQINLSKKLKLTRVSAPLFVEKTSGFNDNLTGKELPVSFVVNQDEKDVELEIIHSLAKWKRNALYCYKIPVEEGIYTDMNAIRANEICDNTHSYYVDQWDWEKVIDEKDRNENYLYSIVREIYKVLLDTEDMLSNEFHGYKKILPDKITFITTDELELRFPNLQPEEREKAFCKEKKAIFVSKIGSNLRNGKPHGVRSPDYDDWSLNGDIIVWNPILDNALELSSMGIRVDSETLVKQLEQSNNLDRLNLDFHKNLIDGKYPQCIGGGIGQSRICMFLLQKAHIGEVQSSIWPKSMVDECVKNGINLL
ncbi:aspartate--ammonia ligase [Lagierella sp.]|uniref:aspartate--ammonia ligase n=1 Tax=Lagierella sp. TaxID=2849657 RepID=UPI002617412A|nr:aspartate--ammonia ligase [Lagierella sp.]